MTDKTIQQIILTPDQIEAMKARLRALGVAACAARKSLDLAARAVEKADRELAIESKLAASLGVVDPLYSPAS